jgi:hypothetical protein
MIIFETPFSSVPKITFANSNTKEMVVTISDITSSSFVINGSRMSTASYTVTVTWSAVLEQDSNLGIELLWSNPNQNSEFSAQTINIDTSKYSRFLVLASYYTATEYTTNELLNVKGITQNITTNVTGINKRTATVNDNGIAFGKGVFIVNNSWADSNANTVPKFIYGVY